MNKPLEQLLKEATKDLLTPESLAAITEAFSEQVKSAVAEKLSESGAVSADLQKLAIQVALDEQDTDYANKLEKLLEAIDNDHTLKLEKIVDRIDENHSAKLMALAEKYNTEAKAEADAFKKTLVEKVSKFLEMRLNESIPTAQITEAVSNRRAQKIVKAIREAVSLDEAFINGEIRSALKDGKSRIDESAKTVATLQSQIKVLTEQAQKLKTSLLLEQKTSSLTKEKKEYVAKILANKDEKFINENFSYVIDMFEKNEEDEAETLKEDTKTTTEREGLDQPVITETTEDAVDPEIAQYLEGMK